jgi:cellulose synthase/poly-beta-1,6-N-acetylglucosamine synthase-like glycosyltransferase
MAWLAWSALILAAIPAALGGYNLLLLRAPRRPDTEVDAFVSILIPARNEAATIGRALSAARASVQVPVEILVMDDGSTDSTAAIVRCHSGEDSRIRLFTAPRLPHGWSGKSHACHQLALRARGTHLLFADADVELAPHAAAAMAQHARDRGVALVSAVPRQRTGTLGELLTVPMINLLLLGYLPIGRMRATTDPALGAACGQLLLVDFDAYRASGGHAAVRDHVHDALMLVRHLRRAGWRTDLVAGAELASCRMYDGLASAWSGFLKNAHEGMATPRALPVWTVLLAGGHVLPFILVVFSLAGAEPLWPAAAALLLSLGLRTAVTIRAGESLWAVPLHPATVATSLAVQWTALARSQLGRTISWKGRAYHAG